MEKYHMIISINAEKLSDKIEHSLMGKTPRKTGIGGNVLYSIKETYLRKRIYKHNIEKKDYTLVKNVLYSQDNINFKTLR